MAVEIRPLKSQDATIAAALHARAGAGRAWSAVEYAALLARSDVHGVMALENGLPSGFALWSVIGDEAELYEIAVDAAWRRQGIGRQLMGALEADLRHQGANTLHLEVAEDNTAARQFYHTLGFVAAGRRAGYYTDGPAPVDAVIMRKQISI